MQPAGMFPAFLFEAFQAAPAEGQLRAVRLHRGPQNAGGVPLQTMPVVFLPVGARFQQMIHLGRNGGCAGLFQHHHPFGVEHFLSAVRQHFKDFTLKTREQAGIGREKAGPIEVPPYLPVQAMVRLIAVAVPFDIFRMQVALAHPLMQGIRPVPEMDDRHAVVVFIVQYGLDAFTMVHRALPRNRRFRCSKTPLRKRRAGSVFVIPMRGK